MDVQIALTGRKKNPPKVKIDVGQFRFYRQQIDAQNNQE